MEAPPEDNEEEEKELVDLRSIHTQTPEPAEAHSIETQTPEDWTLFDEQPQPVPLPTYRPVYLPYWIRDLPEVPIARCDDGPEIVSSPPIAAPKPRAIIRKGRTYVVEDRELKFNFQASSGSLGSPTLRSGAKRARG